MANVTHLVVKATLDLRGPGGQHRVPRAKDRVILMSLGTGKELPITDEQLAGVASRLQARGLVASRIPPSTTEPVSVRITDRGRAYLRARRLLCSALPDRSEVRI